ncbi:MAG: peptidoglycan-binding protein [Candidatus Colwellbacteria bacterium]|nr:peptidoglycan-binding protein [Candidatus Colwellbacteria bacterium]
MIRKNVKKYIGIFALAALAVAVMGTAPTTEAAYNDITFDAETTLLVGGQTLYVLNGGTAVSYTINSTSVSFEMTTSSSITVRSLAKKILTTTPAGAYSCASTFSSASLTSTQTETFTITPTATTCSIPAGGGGGAVTTSGGTTVTTVTTATTTSTTTTPSAPAPTTESAVTPAPVTAAPQVSAPSVQITGGTPFAKRLSVSSQNSDVRQLQEMLLNDGVYPEGRITGYYGQLTKKAVQRFQEKYGIAKQGDPGYGDVGPNTRAKLNQMLEGTSAASTAPLAQGTQETAVKAQLESQVKALQEQLVLLLAELAKQLQSQVQSRQ